MMMGTQMLPNQRHVMEIARQKILLKPVYLDTETTGLDNKAEIIEIGIISSEGDVLFESLVRPLLPIPWGASRLHGITNEMVKTARFWPDIWKDVRGHLLNHPIGIYNDEFDLRMMRQSMERHRQPWRDYLDTFDILKLYAEYRGMWDPSRKAYRFFKLEEAGSQLGIPIPNSHRAIEDSRLARAVLHCMAGLEY